MRARCAWLVALLLVTGCGPDATQDATPRTDTLSFVALGTLVDVTLVAGASVSRPELDATLTATLASWDEDFYAYGDGELARANARWAQGGCVSPSTRLRQLIVDAQQLEARHGDRFGPALADVTRLWQLHTPNDPDWRPPSPAEVTAAMTPPPRAASLDVQDAQVCATGPVALDTGAYAKGRALDALAQVIRDAGISNALINIGGDVSAIGQRPDGPWRVAIADPVDGQALAVLPALDGETVVTSGDYARHREFDGVRYGHILDPVSGWPLAGIASVTVIGRDATRTDAAATALSVAAARHRAAAGPDSAPPVVADASSFVILDVDDHAWISADLATRIQWRRTPSRLTVVSR